MEKTLQQKPKRKGTKTNNSFKVVLPFGKKNITNMEEGKRKKKIASPVNKTPPLYSSTPKPGQKPIPFPVSIPIPLSTGQPFFEKELMIVLERVKVPPSVAVQKSTVQSEVKKQDPPMKKKGTKLPSERFPLRKKQPNRRQKNQTSKDPVVVREANITTQIPSEILKTFGISSPLSRIASPSRSSKKTNSVLIETPPRTSTASSSMDCADHTASLEATSTSLSDDGFVPNSCPATPTYGHLGLSLQPNLILSNILEQDGMQLANVSSSSLVDPLETLPQKISSPVVEFNTLSSHCELLYGLAERLFLKPDVYNLDELSFNNSDVRLIAPYSLRIGTEEDKFFLYVAPVSRTTDKYCCLVFGILNQYLIAYGGHFLVPKDQIYDPVKKEPVDDVKLTNIILCRQHLGLFNIPNKMLMDMEDYVPRASHPTYQETLLSSLDVFLSSIEQVKLKEKVRSEVVREQTEENLRISVEVEPRSTGVWQSPRSDTIRSVTTNLCEPRIEQFFSETCLPITGISHTRILDKISSLETLKLQYGEMGSFLQNCATETGFHTFFYAAHEAPGCMPFYKNVFLLGHVENRYVVAVVEGEHFFIMATERLYSRYCPPSTDMQPVKYRSEMLETIYIPLFIPIEQALTILEARQVLRHPYKFSNIYQQIVQSLGVSVPSSTNFFTCSQPNSQQYGNWLEKMLEENFTATFRHSLCQFPVHPTSSASPSLFVENVTKLWIHQLMRHISGMEDAIVKDDTHPTKLSVLDFFTLDTSSFISYFLPLFGMSGDSKFQCLRLGTDGLPTAICLESLPARQIGLHVHQCHTLPLLRDKNDPQKKPNFLPFTLVFQQHLNPPLSEIGCDFDTLSWARSVVERWSREASQSYLKLVEVVENIVASTELQLPVSAKANPKSKKAIEGQKTLTRKRRHTSGEETSRNLKRHHL